MDWPPVTDKVLYRPVLAEHFDEVADREGIPSTVIVEASSRVEDNQWVLDLVKRNPRYLPWSAACRLVRMSLRVCRRFSKDSRFVGIRMRDPWEETDSLPMRFGGTWACLRKRADLGVLIHNFTIDEVTEVAKRLPGLKIMINHLGGLSITRDPFDPDWKQSIEKRPSIRTYTAK